MYEDVLRFWMERDQEGSTPEASKEVVRHLKLYGPSHPHLYTLVLRFLTSSPDLLSRHMDDVKEIIQYIDKEGIMPPLGIIQVLSRNSVASIGLIKEWLIERIKGERAEIQAVSSWFAIFDCHLWLSSRLGPRMDQFIPDGDIGETQTSQRTFRPGTSQGVSSLSMLKL